MSGRQLNFSLQTVWLSLLSIIIFSGKSTVIGSDRGPIENLRECDAANGTAPLGNVIEYDKGDKPAVVVVGNRTVFEVHETPKGDSLVYKLGTINGSTINWIKTKQLDNKGKRPQLAATSKGLLVMVYQQASSNGDDRKLYIQAGKVTGDDVKWADEARFGFGKEPSVALADDGTAVVTNFRKDDVVYRMAKVNEHDGSMTIDKDSRDIADGGAIAVSMNTQKKIVAVFYEDGLKYMVGDVKEKEVAWLTPPKLANINGNERGSEPTVTLNDKGRVFVSYNSRRSYLRATAGKLNGTDIQFGEVVSCKNGEFPSVGGNNDVVVRVHTNNDDKLFYAMDRKFQ